VLEHKELLRHKGGRGSGLKEREFQIQKSKKARQKFKKKKIDLSDSSLAVVV